MRRKFLIPALLSLSMLCASCDEIIDTILEDEEETEQDNGDKPSNNNSDLKNVPAEVKAAFEYLNKVRANPAAYSGDAFVDLSGVKPIHELRWDKALAKAAQDKAEDMANRNYFDHVDPDGYGMNYFINAAGYKLDSYMLEYKSDNFFESIAAGNDKGVATINQLIYDYGDDNETAGHRRHLLGIDDYYAKCYDIGIGMAYSQSNKYHYFWSILIARHD